MTPLNKFIILVNSINYCKLKLEYAFKIAKIYR